MLFRTVLGTGLVAFPALLAAQRTPPASTPPRDTLAAAVITATRVAISTVAPTASSTMIRSDEFHSLGISRVADALQLVPGAVIVGSGAIGAQTSLFLRGGNSNYVRVLVDGVPVNDAGGFLDLANFSLSNIDRIEIVRGPASVLYGSEAVTGVIQLFTRQGVPGPLTTHASTGAGSFGARRANASLAGGNANARYSLGAAHQATNGILPFNNRYTNGVLSGALALSGARGAEITINARWSSAEFHYPTDFSGAVVDRNAEQTDHRLTVAVDAARRVSRRVELRAALTSNEFLPRSNDGADNAADTIGFFGYFARGVRTRRGADLRANIQLAARSVVTLGIEVARDRERSSSLSLSEYGPSNDGFEASRHNTGAFVQAVGDAGGRWSYAMGARQDDNSAFGAHTTSRASLAFVAGPNLRLRAATGTAFKAPSFYENFATGYVIGNPTLRPETSRSAELGIDVVAAEGKLTLASALFAQRFTDIVQYTGTAPSAGAPNYYNVAGADANGVELDARWQIGSRTALAVAYTYTDTRVTATGFDASSGASYVKGERLIRRPPHVASARVRHRVATEGNVSIVATRIGERDDRDFTAFPTAAATLPAYTKLDFAASFPFGTRGLSINTRADNLLDASYEDVVRFRAPGRSFYVGIEWSR